MWLPRIERSVLVYFYRRGKSLGDWVDFDPRKDHHQGFMEGINCLLRRKLLEMGWKVGKDGKHTGVLSINLTLEGRDLGRKYDNWFDRTGLWYAEYKHHWLWVVIAFVAGIVGTIYVQWFCGKYLAAGG